MGHIEYVLSIRMDVPKLGHKFWVGAFTMGWTIWWMPNFPQKYWRSNIISQGRQRGACQVSIVEILMLPVESWLYTRVHNSPERGQPKERNTSTTTPHCWQITQNVAFELLFGNETFGVIFKRILSCSQILRSWECSIAKMLSFSSCGRLSCNQEQLGQGYCKAAEATNFP